MPAVVIDLATAEDPRDVVHLAVQALAEGKLVVFPTETVYGIAASALNAQAVCHLLEAKGRREGHPLTLAIRGPDEVLDYVPNLTPLAQRLARRCWPGPVTLVLDNAHPDSAIKRLPSRVQQAVCPEKTVGLRVPAHQTILSVLRLCAGPLVLTSANRSGSPEAVTAQEVLQTLGEHVELVLDDGQSKYAQASSVVRVRENQWQILRSGVVNEQTLRRLSGFMALLVCTGNTCRSPMAEVLMRRRLAARLGCSMEELEERGVIVRSAGIAAMSGGRASPEAVQVMQERQLSLAEHQTQPVTDRLVHYADIILTMTRGHRDAIVAQWPDVAPRTMLLSHEGRDIADPVGGPVQMYRQCADQIDSELARWVDTLELGIPQEDT